MYLVAEDIFYHLLSEIWCYGVSKLIHWHYVLIYFERQIHTAKTGEGAEFHSHELNILSNRIEYADAIIKGVSSLTHNICLGLYSMTEVYR